MTEDEPTFFEEAWEAACRAGARAFERNAHHGLRHAFAAEDAAKARELRRWYKAGRDPGPDPHEQKRF